jgi:hypothetical protein
VRREVEVVGVALKSVAAAAASEPGLPAPAGSGLVDGLLLDFNFNTVPPDIGIESFSPDFQFNWQNPRLLEDIYPFRLAKLADFLAYFTEVKLLKVYRQKGITDADIQARIEKSKEEMRLARQMVVEALQEGIEVRKQNDPYFARIIGSDPKNQRFRQKYYLDRAIERLEDKLFELQDEQATLLKRVNWYSDPNDFHIALWKARAAELDPKIEPVKAELEATRRLRKLFDQEERLPNIQKAAATVEDVTRWEMGMKRERWAGMSQEALLEEIFNDWFQGDPDSFPEWLQYMVVHFSGMRYMSAHSSWAEPRHLLELLAREEIEGDVKGYDAERLSAECGRALIELQKRLTPGAGGPKQEHLNALIRRMENPALQRRALSEHLISEELEDIARLPNDNACLGQLIALKRRKEAEGDPMPPWVWAEIVKYTPLRLDTDNSDWEAFSPQRWRETKGHWLQILNTWETKDVTGWRQKHRETLELVVTRAVCNEIAEHIQHLRGLTPVAGLAARPYWYMRQAAADPEHAFFVQAPDAGDFVPGASILWMEWLETQPNAWQVAHRLPGFSLFPGQKTPNQPGRKGEVRKKDLEKEKDDHEGWKYQEVDNTFIRMRAKPSPQELKKLGKTEKEIRQIMLERKVSGSHEKQYLRWRHEATVIGVVDMVDGRYVMTFETGKIGVILRRLSGLANDPMIFVGYVPEAPGLPLDMDKKLVEMLRWDRILPKASLPERRRPRKRQAGDGDGIIAPPPMAVPQRAVVTLRAIVRGWRIFALDNMERPKMEAVKPAIQFGRGVRIQVSTTHKEGRHDSGNGLIHANDGTYLKITQCEANPKAVGTFIKAEDVADQSAAIEVMGHPQLPKINLHYIKSRDDKGKPAFEPTPLGKRVQIPSGTRFRISTVHTESFKDRDDGTIYSSGLQEYCLVVECEQVRAAEGLFVEKEELIFPT